MAEPVGRPAYQEVASDLRRRIAAEEFRVGAAIPSTAKLTEMYGVSITVIRAAINQLRTEGLLVGQPGKGVFVRATPEAAAQQAVSIDDLSKQIAELRAELTALRGRVGMIQAHLGDLYESLGRQVPDDLDDLLYGRPADNCGD